MLLSKIFSSKQTWNVKNCGTARKEAEFGLHSYHSTVDKQNEREDCGCRLVGRESIKGEMCGCRIISKLKVRGRQGLHDHNVCIF